VALGLAVPVVSALGQPFTSVALAAVVAATATLQQPYDRVERARVSAVRRDPLRHGADRGLSSRR